MKKTRNLDNLERARIWHLLLEKSSNGKPKYGAINEIATQFGVNRRTVTMIWNEAKKQHEAGTGINVDSKLKGRKMPHRIIFDTTQLESIELGKRTTQHEVGVGMGVSQATVSRWVTSKQIDSHSNAIKPLLTDKNKLERLIYCLQQLRYDKVMKVFIFKDQSHVMHMDEKWFLITKPTARFYVGKKERRPHRCVQSKRFITKVMFMCAVGRPKYGPDKEVISDGKIGIWPFVMEVPAKRTSKNRLAGTLETKCMESINKQVTKDMIIQNVLPNIKAKWPPNYSKQIFLQQDNARPHITNMDADFSKHATEDGWNIQFSYQPPNSPDLNVLDLGFFRAIQSLQQKKKSKEINELVENTTKAFEELDHEKLNYVFITLQACMLEVIKRKGGIDYALPHMHKSKLAAQGILPQYLTADTELVHDSITYVKNLGYESSICELLQSISDADDNTEITEHAGGSNDPTGDDHSQPVDVITEEGSTSNVVQGQSVERHFEIDMCA